MTITRRLIITLGIAILALLVVGGAGLYEQEQSSLRFETAINGFTSGVHELNTATYALIDAQGALTLYSLSNSPTTRQSAKTSLDSSLQKLDQALTAYSGHVHDAQDSKLLNDEKSKIPDYRQGIAKFLKLAGSGYDDEAARRLLTEGSLNNSATNLRQALEKHIDYNIKLSFDRIATNRTVYNATLVRTVILIAAVLVLMLYMAIKLFRSIRRGLKSIRDTLQTVDQSLDFTLRAKVDGQDEISQTGRAFNSLLERLQGNLRSILDGARQVAGASEDLTQVAARVAAAADSQNEASASMAATIGQMTVSVNHITSRAETSQVLAHNAGELAGQGADTITTTIADIRHISGVVDKAANSIRELDSYSARVDTVVGVIRDIADQTNLLALNAAIEAARAGEMGRGFAVVADEVRKLAERTAASTGEISSTIQSMRDRSQMATQQMKEAETLVRDGVGRADRADQAIQQIGTATRETAGVVVEISRSIKEQEVATSTIASQVEQVAGMTGLATSAARAAAASARQLDELAHRQIATLSSYRL